MLTTKYIKERIENVVKYSGGDVKFIIYPFGDNGFLIKQILKEYFGIAPYMIIDNKWSKYNSNIVGVDELRKIDIEDAYILLGVEDELLNNKLYEEMSRIFPKERIINFKTRCDDNSYQISDIREKLNVKNLFPDADFQKMDLKNKNEKINLVFYIRHAYAFWNGIKPLYDCFVEDDRYHVVVVPYSEAPSDCWYIHMQDDRKRLQEDRVEIVDEDDLPEALKPDIVIVAGYAVDIEICSEAAVRILNVSKLSIGIPNKLLAVSINSENHIERNMVGGRMALCDYCIVDTPLYQRLTKVVPETRKEKYVELGHPKFDNIWYALHKNDYPTAWKKLKGKKVVLYAPMHGLLNDGRSVVWQYTFDLYVRHICEYVLRHKEIGLIIRLQNLMVHELLQTGIWKYQDLEAIRMYCEKTENIVFDENDSYVNAFSVMDGVIADSGSAVEFTALPTLKPICITRRDKDNAMAAKMLQLQNYEDILYKAYSLGDVDKFFDYIVLGQDPMLGLRQEKMGEYIKSCDGRNSERIKDFIEKKFSQRVRWE